MRTSRNSMPPDIHPQVALPHIPSNVKDVREVGKIEIDQVVIGSCTNGRLDDLRIAAKILKGKKVAPYVRLIVIPATVEIYRQALKEGLFDIFLSAGAVVSPPTCGPCLGGYMGVLAEGERVAGHDEPEFPGKDGPCPERGLSLQSSRGCCQRSERKNRSSRRSGKKGASGVRIQGSSVLGLQVLFRAGYPLQP